jgi:HPt (histidine-containing phosphotransfer) domain-containing protein
VSVAEVSDQKAILDMDQLGAAFMRDMTIIKQILQAFQETFEHFHEDFENLQQQGKRQEMARLVHGLKGSSANIRALAVSQQSAELQHQLDQDQDYSKAYHTLLDGLAELSQKIADVLAG